MAGKGGKRSSSGARAGAPSAKSGAQAVSGTPRTPRTPATPQTPQTPRTPAGFEPLVTALGGGNLDFSAMLAIADILPVMVAYIDTSFIYRFVNKPLAEWLGLPRREILGRTMREILGDKAFEGREPLLRAALGGERTFYASEIEHATRGHVAVQSDYVPWADPGGAVRGIIILFEDVTEQRVAERALRESEERFRRIANSAPALSSSGTGSYRRSPCVYSAAAHKEAAPETCSSAAKFGAFSKRLP